MNAIMGVADLLAKTDLSAEQTKYVQIFRRAGDNLLDLVNDILDLSKVEASLLELERTGFSLKDKLGKVMAMVAARAQEKGLSLVCEIAPNVPTNLVGDPTRLRQVLLNLLGNAIKFTQSGEVICGLCRILNLPFRLRCVSRSRTAVLVFRARNWTRCSSASRKPTRRRRAGSAAQGWDLRSRSAWWS